MEKQKYSKGVDVMDEIVRLIDSEKDITRAMDSYISELKRVKKESPEKAYNDAKKALIRTGVMTKNGNMKKKIVSWE